MQQEKRITSPDSRHNRRNGNGEAEKILARILVCGVIDCVAC
jgi:hypothetical protein